ncbi:MULTISPECIES: hypothetical protein [Streptomyces]|uniref:hypothetical protein n=1 Tax=Streptomyces TaxID=1883 RepID=UPI002F941950
MRIRTWTTAAALTAALLTGGVATGTAATAAEATAGPVLVGFYGTSEECYAAGAEIVGEHGCVFVGARGWALYVFE